jgi:succinate dehydrogenase / fumarate reductase iron-sulfur subunit
MVSTDTSERDERPRDYQPVHDRRLPVSELLFDRPGAASPFGDDQTFPLPVSALVYRHPK